MFALLASMARSWLIKKFMHIHPQHFYFTFFTFRSLKNYLHFPVFKYSSIASLIVFRFYYGDPGHKMHGFSARRLVLFHE
jgi:hypothetical protein